MRLLCLRRQTQDHVMVLTAVELWPEKLRPLQQFPVKHAEMTDIIVGAQVIDCKIRLKMQRDHMVDAVPEKAVTITMRSSLWRTTARMMRFSAIMKSCAKIRRFVS